MDRIEYSDLLGIELKDASLVAPQVSALKLDNFILNKVGGGYVKRGGSSSYSVTGNILGYCGYSSEGATSRVPVKDIPIRHRRNGSTSYIESLDWTTDVWAALTLGAYTSFSDGNIMSADQIGDLLCLAAGRPAKVLDPTTGTVTRLGGNKPNAAPTLAVGAAGALTGTYSYVLTFYDATSGWESSPSAISADITVSATKINLSAIPTTADRENVSHVRIYRTITTNEQPFLYVGEVTLGTSTYIDNIDDAALGDASPDFGDHDAPPTDCYIVAAYKSRLWIASGSSLYYSLPDDGSGIPLEYFSEARVEIFDEKITGLITNRSGGMFIFTPPGFGIHEIIGRFADDDDFQVVTAFPKEGTQFHTSICNGGKNDDEIHFFGRSGSTFITPEGLNRKAAESIDAVSGDVFGLDYNGDVYCWAFWNAAIAQYVVGLALIDTGAISWYNVQTGDSIEWVNAVTGATVDWEL